MTYSYGLHGAPAVGGGLPGLPQRQAGGSGIAAGGAIPVDAQFGYADEQPANAVEVGAIVEREDYPALSAQIPHTFEQTVQLPMVKPAYNKADTPVVALSASGKYLYANGSSVNTAPLDRALFTRNGDSFGAPIAVGPNIVSTCAVFSPDESRLYIGYSGSYLGLYWVNTATGAGADVPGPAVQWPVKLLAVSPDGTLLAAASSTTQTSVERVKLWRRSGDTFTAVTLSVTTSAYIYSIDFSKDGKYLYVSQGASPYLRIFDVSAPTPVEVPSGLSFTNRPQYFKFKVLKDDVLFIANTIAVPGGQPYEVIKRTGSSWSWGVSPLINNAYQLISESGFFGPHMSEVDNGSRVLVFTNTARETASGLSPMAQEFLRIGDIFSEDVSVTSLVSSGLVAKSQSVSEDSKFLALGLNASPWLAVYGSESKMVARLNERSPTGQKLYIKG